MKATTAYAFRTAVLVFVLGLAACGPQPQKTEAPPQGQEVTVKLLTRWGTPAAGSVLYQTGDAAWRPAAEKAYGVYAFTVPEGENRYGVSASCPPPSLGSVGRFITYQLTTDDATEVVLPCATLSDQRLTRVTVEWNADALLGERLRAYSRIATRQGEVSPIANLRAATGPDQPFLFLAYGAGWRFSDLVGVRYQKLTVPPNMTVNVTFTNADAPELGNVSGPATPTGFGNCILEAAFDAASGLVATGLGQAGGNPCSGQYLRLPEAGDDDTLLLIGRLGDRANQRLLLTMTFADPRAGAVALPDPPDPWPTGYTVTPARWPGFELNHPDGHPTGYSIFFSDEVDMRWQVYISPSWLNGATRYTLPDLSSNPGFGGLELVSGEVANWEVAAFFSDRPLGDWLSTPRWLPMPRHATIPVLTGAEMTAASVYGSFPVP